MKSNSPRWPGIVLAAIASLAPTVGLEAQCQVARLDSASISYCVEGSGSPTIVLAAGAGMSSSTWAALRPRLAGLGTVISFDRPGLGRSPSARSPRSPARISTELVQLLEQASLPEPFLFVGHSMGGIHVAGAAALVPTRTAAVVLLDTPHPDFESRRLDLLTPQQRRDRARTLEQGLVGAPSVVEDERTGARTLPMQIVPNALASTPLIVVVANEQHFGDEQPEAHRHLWLQLSHELLSLSTDSRLLVAEGSGHMVHLERPELVLEVLRSVTSTQR